ncbi:hypothetical protein TNCV_3762781 [Trichonephila clavipes]|nr:hypothetical protein TNCV_3762781 [Trichonephila clavipes]
MRVENLILVCLHPPWSPTRDCASHLAKHRHGAYLEYTQIIVLQHQGEDPMESFAMREKGGNHFVPGTDCMEDALKLPNQAPRVSGESLQTCVASPCPDGTQHLFCWPILTISVQLLASNGSVVDSRDLNLLFAPTEEMHNKLFLSSLAK